MSWKEAFKSVRPGEEPSPAPVWLQTWTSQTVYGTAGGMLYGGYCGLQQAKNLKIPSPIPTTSTQHRMQVFFVRESILTGARLGLFTATFSAAVLLAEKCLHRSAAENHAAAGATTCGLFAAAVARGILIPAAAGFGAIAGAVAGAGTDGLKLLAAGMDKEEEPEKESALGRVIRSLESSQEKHK